MHYHSALTATLCQTVSALLTAGAYLILARQLKVSRLRKILPVSVFLLLFLAWQLAPLFWDCNHSCFRKAKIVTIGTYNTGGLIAKEEIKPGSRQYPKSEISLDALAETIRRADADVVALQEVASEKTLRNFLESRGLSKIYPTVVFDYTNSRHGQHLAFISKYPYTVKKSHANHKIPLADGTGYTMFSRDLFRADFNIDGKPGADITVYTAHSKSRKPSAPGQINSDTQRISEAMAIRSIIDKEMQACPGRLFVLAADLNDECSNKSVQMILTPKDGGKTWKDSLAVLSKDKTSTWPSDPKYSGGFSPAQLDHIIYPAKYNSCKKVKMKSSRVHRYGPSDSLNIPNISAEASDHLMITADFKVKR